MKKMLFIAILSLMGCGPTVEVEECATCSEAFSEHELVYKTCHESLQKYDALYACACDPYRPMPFPCQEWCGGGELSQQCLLTMENKCFTSLSTCQTDSSTEW